MTRKSMNLTLLLLSLLAGAGLSRGKLAYHCRIPASEACVWGKSFYRVTLPVETLVFGVGIFLLTLIIRSVAARRIHPKDGGE